MAEWKNRIVGYGNIPVNEIVKNPNNPKEHPEYQKRVLSGVLEDVGVVQNIIINKRTGHLVDGECRYFLAIDSKQEFLPATYVDLSIEEEEKILLTLDETTSLARKNAQIVGDIIKRITTASDSMRDLIDRIARQSHVEIPMSNNGDDGDESEDEETKPTEEAEKVDEDNDFYQNLIEKWEVEPGKIWNIKSKTFPTGMHRLMCGDAQSKEDVKLLSHGEKASLMATDPPYGVAFKEQKYNPRAKEWDGIKGDDINGENYRKWVTSFLNNWLPYMRVDASYYIWTAALYESFMCLCGIEDAGIHVQSQIVWNKNTLVLGQPDYQWRHENCWYGFLLGNNHRWFGGRDQTTVWDITKVANVKYLHPMQKPIELYSVSIKNNTRTGDLCFDPFVGSGTQIIACETLSRRCYAMDNDPRYIAVSLQRITDELGLEIEKA